MSLRSLSQCYPGPSAVKWSDVPNSQNARFRCATRETAGAEHLPGRDLSGDLSRELATGGWRTGPPYVWRDSGWEFECSRSPAELTVTLAQLAEPGEWLLQIAPAHSVGVIGALLGRKASGTPEDVLRLAQHVHGRLLANGSVSGLRWRWDGEPTETDGTPQPTAPTGNE